MATQAEIDQAKQEAADAKMREAADKAYNKASTSTAPAPAKKMAKGGSVGSASRRADGIAQRGKTRGRMM